MMVWLGSVLLVIVVAVAAFSYYACAVPSSEIFRPVMVRGPADGRRIVVSLDDGPSSPFTEQILDILREKKVPATFFVCGANVERYPDIVKRIVRDGHTLGNHTYSHPALAFRTPAQMADEVDRTQSAIEKVVGIRTVFFRPPYGIRLPGLMGVLGKRGLKLIMWSATGYDWKCGAEEIVRLALKELHPGSIILLHDGHNTLPPDQIDRSATVRALPELIDKARDAGFEFVSLGEFVRG